MRLSLIHGIQAKVVLLALICSVLPAILVSIVAYSSSRQSLEQAVRVDLSAVVEDQLSRLTSSLKRAETDLVTWSTLHTMQNVLIDDIDGIIQNELVALRKRYPNFAELLVLNSNGLTVASALGSNKGKTLADTTFYSKALTGAVYEGRVEFDPLIAAKGLVIAAPIRADYDPSVVVGVLTGIIDWTQVERGLASVPIWGSPQDENHRLYLRTARGNLLYGRDKDLKAVAELASITGVESVTRGNMRFLVGTHASETPSSNGSQSWLMHAMVSEDVALATVNTLRNRVLFGSMLVIGAALVVGAFASRRWLVTPIQQVTSAMTKVSTGNVQFDISFGRRRDEIGQMFAAISIFRSNLLRDNELLKESERILRVQNARFDAALTNMSHGLSMFDDDGKLVVWNKQFEAIYRLPANFLQAGTLDLQIAEHCLATGLISSEFAENVCGHRPRAAIQGTKNHELLKLNDGRVIAVAQQPMLEGGWVSVHEDVTERHQIEARIAHMARHDALTGLPNRVLFREKIEAAVKRTGRGESIAILCLDLDYFKSVNDTLGHPIGDALLQSVATRLRECLRDEDIVARLGGDEFAIIQIGASQPDGATSLAKRINSMLSAPYEIGGHQVVIGSSIGIALAPADGTDSDKLLKSADMALYRAKADGRGTYRYFEPEMDAKMQTRRALEIDLRKALACEEFELHYQPLVRINTGETEGFEALVRWNHPQRGMVSPAEFIPLAEEIGLIVPLGEWILRQACADAAKWPAHIRVAVNLSPVQFKSSDLVLGVFNALAKSKLAAARLELEITETVLLQKSETTLDTLHRLRSMGVRISMDDFGTGYSSLSYLRSFPFDKIKIDQSFIQDLTTRDDALVIVRAVSAIGSSLGIETTAEGVESEAQLEKLRSEGFTQVQGYLLGRPLPRSAINSQFSTSAAANSAQVA
jgi:diguanylate cyclase (GGDEF)-like protein